VNVYWNDYLRYWQLYEEMENAGLTDRQRAVLKSLGKVGEALRGALHTLAPDSKAVDAVRQLREAAGESYEPSLDATARYLRAFHASPLVRDCVSISLAFEVADSLLPAAEERVGDLVALIAARRLSPIAAHYLERATRLHLWGFEPEAVIMCRSVLEAALVERLSTAITLDEPPPSLETLNRLAGELNLLPGFERAQNRRGWRAKRGTALWDAERIRRAANQLLHELPEPQRDEDGLPDSATAVRVLAGLLDRLFPTRGTT
jgi:hypothetical protein